jgi:DHA1 family multidrug resistance protein B-like MFS transporter
MMLDNRVLWIISAASSIRSIGYGATWPYMAIFFNDELHISIIIVGLIFTVLAVLSMVFSLIGGALADYIGRRKTIIIGSIAGFFLYLAISVFFRLDLPVSVIVATFVFTSFSGSLVFPSASALVSDVTKPEQRFMSYSIYRVMANLGWAIGPVIGGLVYYSGMFWLFLLVSVANLIQFSIVFFLIREKDVPNKWTVKKPDRKFNLLSFDKYLIIFSAGTFLITIVASQFSVTLPTFSVTSIGIRASDISYIFMVNGIVVVLGQYPMTALMRKFPDVVTMMAGALLYSIGYFMVGVSPNLLWLILDMIIITAGENLTSPGINSIVSRIAPKDKVARYMGFVGMVNSTGRAIGPSIGTTLMFLLALNGILIWSFVGVFGAAAILILIAFSRLTEVRKKLSVQQAA